MIGIIGEILIDRLPDGHRPGGAPFNVAQHLTRLGAKACLISRVGCDGSGAGLISTMEQLGMCTDFIQRDPHHSTGWVAVELSGLGIPAYSIAENVAYDHIDFQALDFDRSACSTVCFGSLIQRSEHGREHLHDYLASLPESVLRLYDMNLRPGCGHAEVVFQSLEKTDVLKINDEELEHTGRLLGSPLHEDDLVRHIMERFRIPTVALTLGAAGSVLFTKDGKWTVPAKKISGSSLVDTVGAGDSFTAVLAHGLTGGWPPDVLLECANRLAGRMCTVHGAVPDDPQMYCDIKIEPRIYEK